jgi:hypothetical protein
MRKSSYLPVMAADTDYDAIQLASMLQGKPHTFSLKLLFKQALKGNF